MTAEMDSPTGLDMHPRPPAAVRVRKGVGVAAVIAAGMFAMAIVCGVYERQNRQVQASFIADAERKAKPATSASQEFTSQIPPGGIPVLNQDAIRLKIDRNRAPRTNQRFLRKGEPVGWRRGCGPSPPHRLRFPTRTALRGQKAEIASLPIKKSRRRSRRRLEPVAASLRWQCESFLCGRSSAIEYPNPQTFNGSGSAANLPRVSSGDLAAGMAGVSQAAEYNAQNAQDQKTAFIVQARSRMPENYLQSVRTAPVSRFEIKAGWDIPATLEQAINSDKPGEIKALGRENVYDTATGKYVLLPQGSRLAGYYNSVVSYGQDGIQAVWDRVIFPDGSSLNLAGIIGQDAKGQSGLRYAVNHHYGRLIGFAALTSLFSAGFELSQSRRGTILAVPSAGEVVGGAVGREISQLGVEITRRDLNLQPTIKVPAGQPGYRFRRAILAPAVILFRFRSCQRSGAPLRPSALFAAVSGKSVQVPQRRP